MSRDTRVPLHPHDAFLAAALRSGGEHAHPRGDCPPAQRLWDAVRLDVPTDERLRIIDHLAECPTCAEAWQLAGELAAAERAATGEPAAESPLQAAERKSVAMRAFGPLGTMFGGKALALGVGALLLALGVAFIMQRQSAVRVEQPPEVPVAAPLPPSYRIKAVLNREQNGMKVPVEPSGRLAPSDRLSLDIDISVPLYVYVVWGDERGNSSLVFPSADDGTGNPLPAGAHQLPDRNRDGKLYIEGAPGGGRQHLLVIASPTRSMLEEMFARLPPSPPRSPLPADSTRSNNEPGPLRSRYGIVLPSAVTGGQPYADRWFRDPLPMWEETARGVWIREATYEYPSSVEIQGQRRE